LIVSGVILFGVASWPASGRREGVLELIGFIALGFALAIVASLWSAGGALAFPTIQAGPSCRCGYSSACSSSYHRCSSRFCCSPGGYTALPRIQLVPDLHARGHALISGADPRVALAFAVALAFIGALSL
jgi:hypothetical protein